MRFRTSRFLLVTALLALSSSPTRADILYAGNYNNNTIVKFTSDGTASLFVSFGTVGNGTGLLGLAFDSAANLYASTPGDNTIEKFTPGGVGSVFGDASDGLNGPLNQAFDSAGNLYVRTILTTIAKFTPGGIGSVFGTGL